MAYKLNGNTLIQDSRDAGENYGFSNVTIQNGFLQIDSADTFQGTVAGFSSGGAGNPIAFNTIEKFPFASDTNGTDVGDLTVARGLSSGASSSTHGYNTSGFDFGVIPSGHYHYSRIDKFSFSAGGNASLVGDIGYRARSSGGNSSETNGYHTGGVSPTFRNDIYKFPFSVDTNAADIGNLATLGGYGQASHSSTINGYIAGASPTGFGGRSNTIEKFSFIVDQNSSDVGDLTTALLVAAGQSSTTHGYTSGGLNPSPAAINTIDRFPFATDTNASDVGDLTQSRNSAGGSSSTASGYTMGGSTGPGTPNYNNTIDKFPFASNNNATDVGDLTQARPYPTGHQD